MVEKVKKEKVEKEVSAVNPIDALFDENNTGNITLFNEKNEPVEFEQIAIIPLVGKVYAILKPTAKIDGVKDDEAFVFEVVEDEENGDTLKLVEEDKIIDTVFIEYNKLLNTDNK